MQTWIRMTDAATVALWNVGMYAWVRGREAALLRAETGWLQGTRSATTAMLMMATAAALTAPRPKLDSCVRAHHVIALHVIASAATE